jgi:hypothetical protein
MSFILTLSPKWGCDKVVVSFFSLELDSFLLICTTWTQININIAKATIIYKTLLVALNFSIIITFTKEALQMFCAINMCDTDQKNDVSYKNRWFKKMCDKEKCD